ncbi:MAG: ankyrin repeat domain-containing protein [Rickettsiaceae bacterium]|nr:ankyrin repeat domain-containing protein [Rickettsiaceae bacterium]
MINRTPEIESALIRAQNNEVLRLLELPDTDINALNDEFLSPLYLASEAGNLRIVELLKAKGARLNPEAPSSNTPLHAACLMGHVAIAKLLIESGANVSQHDLILAKSPLHSASESGSWEIIELLVKQGADVNQLDGSENTPLHIACQIGSFPAAKILIENGAMVNMQNFKLASPLHYASKAGNLEIVSLLLQNKAMINCRDKDLNTPLHFAIESSSQDTITFLLNSNPDVTASNIARMTPLHYASEFGNPEAVDMLIKMGCDINQKNRHGNSALHFAAKSDNRDTINLLIENRADIDTRNLNGQTPLIYSCYWVKPSIAQILIMNNSSILDLTGRSIVPGWNPDQQFPNEIVAIGNYLRIAEEADARAISEILLSNYTCNDKDKLSVIQARMIAKIFTQNDMTEILGIMQYDDQNNNLQLASKEILYSKIKSIIPTLDIIDYGSINGYFSIIPDSIMIPIQEKFVHHFDQSARNIQFSIGELYKFVKDKYLNHPIKNILIEKLLSSIDQYFEAEAEILHETSEIDLPVVSAKMIIDQCLQNNWGLDFTHSDLANMISALYPDLMLEFLRWNESRSCLDLELLRDRIIESAGSNIELVREAARSVASSISDVLEQDRAKCAEHFNELIFRINETWPASHIESIEEYHLLGFKVDDISEFR